MPTPEPWSGDLYIRPGVVAFEGNIGAAEPHAHAAIQLYRCSIGKVTVSDSTGASVSAATVVIPTRATHRVHAAPGTRGTTVFLDPSGPWAPAGGDWKQSVHSWADSERAAYVATTLDRVFDASSAPNDSFGGRVERWVRAQLPEQVIAQDLAQYFAMSEATLRRTAQHELGLGVQAYTRWVRLIVALEQVAAGRSITDAAHQAGFTDGSHATRACREMFGLSPSDAIAHLSFSQS